MTPKQAAKELDKVIDLTTKLGENACLCNSNEWRKNEMKWMYMNVLLNISNKLKEVKKEIVKK